MYRDRIWSLFSRKLAGEATPEELTELEDLLRQDPDMHYSLQNVTDIWHLTPRHIKEGDDAFLRHLEKLKSTTTEWKEEKAVDDTIPPPTRPGRKLLYLLATAIILALIGGYFYKAFKAPKTYDLASTSNETSNKIDISAPNGSTTRVSLPDGSTVWLNAGSSLSYDKTFNNGKREVSLSGEAFFDVTRDPAQPFIIHTAQVDIRVLGTSFNVRSYPLEHKTETSLIRGSLEVVVRNRPEKTRILKPEDKFVVTSEELNDAVASESQVSKKKTLEFLTTVNHYERLDNIVIETAWVHNKLIFDNEPLGGIAANMERRYNVEISFKDEAIAQLRFTGAFEDETIQQALEALSINREFKFFIQGNKIIIAK
jgi:transmembrane sensor